MEDREYMNLAMEASKNSYSPYSSYKVGACLVTKDGKVYTGCNIENHGIMSICAERVCFLKAISEGIRDFSKIYFISTKDGNTYLESMPCGYCREFMSEFVDDDFKICTLKDGTIKEYSFNEILPYKFEL